MRRLSTQLPYEVVISAGAWGGLGAVGSDQFHQVQRWLEQEAQGLASQEAGEEETTRGTLEVAGLRLTFEADHAARRLALLSASLA